MSSKYIFQLRRGWKYDSDPTTGKPRDDWKAYEDTKDTNPNYIAPLAGELVLEYDNGVPRLKIGDGINDFSQLEYMSVDSFILPKPNTITLYANKWYTVSTDRYTQDITDQLSGLITSYSKVDLQPTPEQLCAFHEEDVAFTTVNEDGKVRVCAIGIKPIQTYKDIQVTVTEVDVDE